MDAYLNLRTIFDVFCIVQGITTVAWLLLQPKQPANRWLSLLLTGLTFQVIDYFLSRSGIYYRNQWLYFTPLFFSWGFGPLLYGYIQSRTTKTSDLAWWNFIPVAIQVLFYLLLMFQPLTTKTWFWQTVHKPYTRFVEYYVGCLLVLYYIHLSWKLIQQTDIQVSWLKPALKGASLFYVIAMIDPLINSLYLSPQAPKFFLTAQLLPFFVYTIALVGRGYNCWQDQPRPRLAMPVKNEHLEQIRQAIQDNRLYQDPDLTLASLSAQVGLSPNVISRTINTGFGQSFTDYVNTCRVEEVKRLLESGAAGRVTILALALDAGFSSKTTFNRVFKEQTGYTPKDYNKRSQGVIRDDADA